VFHTLRDLRPVNPQAELLGSKQKCLP
jgi:hypothetical protein